MGRMKLKSSARVSKMEEPPISFAELKSAGCLEEVGDALKAAQRLASERLPGMPSAANMVRVTKLLDDLRAVATVLTLFGHDEARVRDTIVWVCGNPMIGDMVIDSLRETSTH